MPPADSLHERVVVITGASSGIGLATALAFARRGAWLALGARRTAALQRAAEACEREGGRAIAVQTDVTDEAATNALARAAANRFGGIDVWINNAGVGLFGPFASANLAAHRRVVETNLFGAMHGAAAALSYFLPQERGILVTNISVGGLMPVPFAAAYTASKFGLRGFMASLRQEVGHVTGIRICSVFPSVIDTPGFSHGANVSGAFAGAGRAGFPPEKVAEAMVSLAVRPRDEVSVGWPTHLAKPAYGIAPLSMERSAGIVFRNYIKRGKPEPKTMGNLFMPVLPGTGTSGGWRKPPARPRNAAASRAIAGGLAAAGAVWLVGSVAGQRSASVGERGASTRSR